MPSLPGEEEELARLVEAEMRRLGYDEVEIDAAGNVLGRVAGRGEAPPVVLNTHLDHVDAGDPARWSHPPFEGVVAGGRVWGRGAVDIKGPLAAQVHGAAPDGDGPPPGHVLVTAVVQEEIGGLGARHLAGGLQPGLVVVGEPSSNGLRRGHRGRAELSVCFTGRSVHASAPDRGVNPLFALAAFLEALDEVPLPVHDELGASTLVPTLLSTDQTSPNVIPGEARLTLDCRLVPGRTAEEVAGRVAPVAERAAARIGAEARVAVPRFRRRSWTGLEREMPADNPAYLLERDHPAVRAAASVLERTLGGAFEAGVWTFATDGGHFAAAGHTVVGFGPGDEALAHTWEESLDLEELRRAVEGYRALSRLWPLEAARTGA